MLEEERQKGRGGGLGWGGGQDTCSQLSGGAEPWAHLGAHTPAFPQGGTRTSWCHGCPEAPAGVEDTQAGMEAGLCQGP